MVVFDNRINDGQRRNYKTTSSPTLLFKIVDYNPDNPGGEMNEFDQSVQTGEDFQATTQATSNDPATSRMSTTSDTLASTMTTHSGGNGEIGKTSTR